jgi:hypothetical protein
MLRPWNIKVRSTAGLPDGKFSNQKSKFGKILEGLVMEDVVIFYGHLVYFTAIWYTLQTFGTFCGNLVYFPVLEICTKKNLATLVNRRLSSKTFSNIKKIYNRVI